MKAIEQPVKSVKVFNKDTKATCHSISTMSIIKNLRKFSTLKSFLVNSYMILPIGQGLTRTKKY